MIVCISSMYIQCNRLITSQRDVSDESSSRQRDPLGASGVAEPAGIPRRVFDAHADCSSA